MTLCFHLNNKMDLTDQTSSAAENNKPSHRKNNKISKITIGLVGGVILVLLIIISVLAATLVYLEKEELYGVAPVLNIEQGPVRGVLSTRGPYYEFLGIPYGTVNASNRFKQAFPPPTWSDIREPVPDIICPQPNHTTSEDCLVVNVYVPANRTKNKLSVMVFIYGGMFLKGKPFTEVQHLMRHDVIIVTLTYRLGVFGFLSLRRPEAPGNAGMKDMVMALRWVQSNIAEFGGDPAAVTIIGNSSGAVCVDLLIISPMAKGLFQQAIIQSGLSNAPWALSLEPNDPAISLGKKLGANSTDINTVFEIINNVTLSQILAVSPTFLTENIFKPTLEVPLAGIESFLEELPYDIISSGRHNKVPMVVGVTDKEQYMHVIDSIDINIPWNENYEIFIKYSLQLYNICDRNSSIEEIKKYYFPNKEPNIDDIVNILSDSLFRWPLHEKLLAQNYSMYKNAFVYEFGYNGSMNILKVENQVWDFKGAGHTDELGYLFDYRSEFPSMVPSKRDLQMVEIMCTMWTNFAKFTDPTPETTPLLSVKWLPIQEDKLNFLKINIPLKTDDHFYEGQMNFWDQLKLKYFPCNNTH